MSPEEAARAVAPEALAARLLGHVRAVARGPPRQGKLVILRHNKPADPSAFKGVYRLRLPMRPAMPAPPEPTPETGTRRRRAT